MAISVRSTSTITGNVFSDPLTFLKPAGLSVGDLLIVDFIVENTSGTITNASGFTTTESVSIGISKRHRAFKYATSGDVAGSNFEFTVPTSKYYLGVMYAIEGAFGNPTSGVSFTPVSANTLAIISGYTSDNDNNIATYSGYSLTGGTSPGFTEIIDAATASGAGDISIGSAWGLYESFTEVTGFAVTITDNGPLDNTGESVFFVNELTNATGTNTLVETTTTTFTQAGTCDGISENTLLETNTTMFAQNGTGTSPTQWTNEVKPSTTWVNKTK